MSDSTPSEPPRPLPPFALDRSVHRSGPGGRLLMGGSPLRLFRLTEAGATLFDRVARGDRVPASPAVTRLVGRWIDAGVVHPDPDDTFGPDDDEMVLGPGDVTVVVPVRDRADGVRRLLGSLEEHTDGLGAVVVVDDGSEQPDELERAVRDAAPAHLEVQLLRRARSGGPAAARNAGAARVSTPLVVFLDSDCTVTPRWWPRLAAHFADPQVALVAPRVRATPADSVLARYDARRSPLDMGPDPARVEPGTRVSYVPSAAIVLRTEDWRVLGGFDESLRVGEDVDLVWRLVGSRRRARYAPRAEVRHDVRDGWRAWLRQRVGYGTSAAALDRRHPGRVAPVVASPWSLGVWALVVAGQPLPAATLALWTGVRLRRTLPDLGLREVVRLVGGGHLGAGRQLAHAVVRVWWPVALPLATRSRRARRVLAVSAGWTLASAWVAARDRADDPLDPLDPLRFAAMVLLDETAYGAGVWLGCVRERSPRALLPTLPPSTTPRD